MDRVEARAHWWHDEPDPVRGSEASRLYDGEFVVRAWFHWPDGTPGEHDTSPLPYEDCLAWLAAAPHTPLIASDGAKLHQVRVERAVIVPAAAA